MSVRISAVICTYNREWCILKCLNSFKIQEGISASDFEIIVVNNNSTDSTEELVLGFIKKNPTLDVKYFIEKNQGLSYARNRGLKESLYEVIAFIDDDAYLSDNLCIKKILEKFSSREDIQGLGIKVELDYIYDKVPSYRTFLTEPYWGYNAPFKKECFYNNTGKYPVGLASMYRKEAILDGFSTKLGRTGGNLLGGEDKELPLRLMKAGHKLLYTPDISITHLVPKERTTKSFMRRQALGVGYSNRIMTLGKSKKDFFIYVFKEFLKWGVVIVLWFYYLLTLRVNKGSMNIFCRFYNTLGMLGYKKGM